MSITSFPNSNTRAADVLHTYATAGSSIQANGTSTTWTPMNFVGGLTTIVNGHPYDTAPFVTYKNSNTDWGWRCQVPGWYTVSLQMDMAADTLAAPPSDLQRYQLGRNGAADSDHTSVGEIRFFDLADYRQVHIHACRRYELDDTVMPGTVSDTSDGTYVCTSIGGFFQRYRE
jgi:hypothetical protein